MDLLIAGLVLFFGVHSIAIVSPHARAAALARLGERGFRGLFSLVSLVGLVLIIEGFAKARQAPVVLYVPPPGLRHVTLLLMLPVFPLVFAAYLPGRIKTAVKHPLLTAVKLWALAHLLANGTLADVLLFGGFLGWAGLERMSLKRRPARAFRTAPPGRYNDLIAVLAGLALYGVMVYRLHFWLFGVSPLAG